MHQYLLNTQFFLVFCLLFTGITLIFSTTVLVISDLLANLLIVDLLGTFLNSDFH